MAKSAALSTIIAAATSNAAGGTTTGTAVDLRTLSYGFWLTIKITNGGTPPTLPAYARILTSGDGTNYKEAYRVYGDTVASSVTEFADRFPSSVMYVRVDVTGNTAQAVTCEAFAQVTTGL